MQININYSRIGKGTTIYRETLISDDGLRLSTISFVEETISQAWCEEAWWPNGFIEKGTLIYSVRKNHFYQQWFSIMELRDRFGNLLGYYCDINRPLVKKNGEYYVQDLMLDLWVSPDGTWQELDWDELHHAAQAGLIDDTSRIQAEQALAYVVKQLEQGWFPKEFL